MTTKAPTFTPEALQAIIKEALDKQAAAFALAMAGNGKGKPAKPAKGSSAANDAECVRVFKKAGFEDVQPRKNIFTFGKWLERGFRPIEGTIAHKVHNLRLFHEKQVRALTAEELGQVADKAAAEAAAKAKGSKPTLVS